VDIDQHPSDDLHLIGQVKAREKIPEFWTINLSDGF